MQSKVLHFLSMNLITHPQRLFSLEVSFGKETKEYWEIRSASTEGQITKWIQRHYLKIVFLLLAAYPLQVLRELTQFKKYMYEYS